MSGQSAASLPNLPGSENGPARVGEATLPYRILQSGRIRFKHAAHFVADAAEIFQDLGFGAGRFGRICEWPVMALHLARKNRAALVQVATDGDDGADGLAEKFLQVLRAMAGNVNAHLGHDFDGERSEERRVGKECRSRWS